MAELYWFHYLSLFRASSHTDELLASSIERVQKCLQTWLKLTQTVELSRQLCQGLISVLWNVCLHYKLARKVTKVTLIVSPDKVGDTLDSARSRRRRRHCRADFLRDAITQKIFALGLSNLVCGFIWGRTPCLLFFSLGLPEIGQ